MMRISEKLIKMTLKLSNTIPNTGEIIRITFNSKVSIKWN